ncbi:MAG: hypothetical protein HQ498_13500 [Pseudohongiella sp.]|jgi:hypothetical protein|nr:hypothetical protein [Pseudohongiella sp.]
MNWDAISALAEIIGTVAIIVSLVYVSVQLQQNTRQITISIEATRLAAFERNIESGNRIRELMLVHPDLADLYGKGRKSYTELNSAEKTRFGMLVRNIFSETQGAFIRQLSIDHDPSGTTGLSLVADGLLKSPGIREFLRGRELDWRPEFKLFVDSRLAILDQAEQPAEK